MHRKDTPLRVWEVILESGGVYSYHPMANPKFTVRGTYCQRKMLWLSGEQVVVVRARSLTG